MQNMEIRAKAFPTAFQMALLHRDLNPLSIWIWNLFDSARYGRNVLTINESDDIQEFVQLICITNNNALIHLNRINTFWKWSMLISHETKLKIREQHMMLNLFDSVNRLNTIDSKRYALCPDWCSHYSYTDMTLPLQIDFVKPHKC